MRRSRCRRAAPGVRILAEIHRTMDSVDDTKLRTMLDSSVPREILARIARRTSWIVRSAESRTMARAVRLLTELLRKCPVEEQTASDH